MARDYIDELLGDARSLMLVFKQARAGLCELRRKPAHPRLLVTVPQMFRGTAHGDISPISKR